jgi:uncharacterized protein (UPF0264 family)
MSDKQTNLIADLAKAQELSLIGISKEEKAKLDASGLTEINLKHKYLEAMQMSQIIDKQLDESLITKEEHFELKRFQKHIKRQAIRQFELDELAKAAPVVVTAFDAIIKDLQAKYAWMTQDSIKSFVIEAICDKLEKIEEVKNG